MMTGTNVPPNTIRWREMELYLYDGTPGVVNGQTFYTYTADDPTDGRLWEHCPATGRTVQMATTAPARRE